MTIADRAVLVTGANRGIGQALVEEALRRGANPTAHLLSRPTKRSLD
jgi:NAD(P)-dependent dehydrogenase (short-subunit alcohol dehydrogenase family)